MHRRPERPQELDYALDLKKMALSILIAFVLYTIAVRGGVAYLVSMLRWHPTDHPLSYARYLYPGVMVIYLMIVVGLIAISWPMARISVFSSFSKRGAAALTDVILGLLVGIVMSLTALPFWMYGDNRASFIAFYVSHLPSLGSILVLALLFVALPLCSEVFFRGVLFRALTQRWNAISGLVVSSIMFALFWPVFGIGISIAVGFLSGIVFYRTRSIIPSAVGSFIVTLAGALFVVIHSLR